MMRVGSTAPRATGTVATRLRIIGAAAVAAVLCAGCARESDAPSRDGPATGAPIEVPATDEPDVAGAPADSVDSGAQSTADPRPMQPSSSGSRPVSQVSGQDTAGVVRAVFGIAEVQVDSSTYAPADYLRVVLRDGRRSFETLTDRSGQYVFENVPAGKYELVFMTPTKDARVVHSAPVTLVAGGKVTLAAVHIPLRSLRTRY